MALAPNHTVWKFELSISDYYDILIPRGAKILTVQMQDHAICAWALVDQNAPMVNRKFRIAGTGHQLVIEGTAVEMQYVGSVQQLGGALVWHVFDMGEEG